MFKPVYFYFCVFYSSEEMNFLRADWSFLFFLSYWNFYYRGKGNFGTLFIKTLFYTFFSFNLLIWSWTFILFVGFSSSVSTIICYLIPFLFSFSFRIWTYYTSLFTSLYCPDLSFLCYFNYLDPYPDPHKNNGSGSRGPNLCGSGRIRIRNTGIRNTADDTTSFISSLSLSSILRIVADPHKFFTDPDPAFYFHVHPDPDPGFWLTKVQFFPTDPTVKLSPPAPIPQFGG